MRGLPLVVLVGCGFHSHAVDDAAPIGDGHVDARPDSSIDGPPPPSSPRRLVINSTGTQTLSNVPLYVSLDASTVDYGAVAAPTTDLRFHDDVANVDLQFEIDHWNAAGESGVWIKVPSLPPGVTSSVLMYFGTTAGGISHPAQVWGAYDLVQHMEAGFASSTSTSYTGSPVGVTSMTGQAGGAATFGGTGDEQMTFAFGNQLFDAWSQFTLEFWIYPDYAAATDLGGNEPLIMSKGVSLNLGRFFNSGNNLELQVDLHFTGMNDVFMPIIVPPGQWSYIAYTFDGSKVRTFLNGTLDGTTTLSGGTQTEPADSEQYYLGDPANPFKGQLDELRISQTVARGGDFLTQQYRAMTRQMITFTAP